MVFLSTPINQSRLNATVHELARMRFHGPVYVGGRWDPYAALEYLELRRGVELIPTMRSDGSLFRLDDKYVSFTDTHVIVCSCLEYVLLDSPYDSD